MNNYQDDSMKEYWTDEFAPKTIDDMVILDEQKMYIKNLLKSHTKFNQLYVGPAGIGKSSICNLIAKELNASILYVQCGINGTVSYAQSSIKSFCDSLSIDGKQKIVLLDELDASSGSGESNFQKTLRNIINEAKDTMFLANCNYIGNVIEPLQSRLGMVNLKFTKKELWMRLCYILKTKNISYTKESLQKFIENVLNTHYPDVRRIISDLQKMCSSGVLVVPETVSATSDITFVTELIEKCSNEKSVLNLRQFYISNKNKIEDYLVFSSELFNYVLDNNIISSGDSVLHMSNIIYQMNLVIDKEISFFSLITYLNKVLNK